MPIGQRLAFDAAMGRLWVVCRACERWNLTPFDTRWEAIEQAERAFRDTRVRVSTEQIGLARLRDGTELVRVGKPLRPEFAAWRYGDQFGRRRRRTLLMGAGAALGGGVVLAGATAFGAGLATLLPVVHVLNLSTILRAITARGSEHRLPDGGRFVPIGQPRLIASGPEGWGIDIGYAMRRAAGDTRGPAMFSLFGEGKNEQGRIQLYGHDALPLLREYLPRINRTGASAARVVDAVTLLEQAGAADAFPRWAASMRRTWDAKATWGDAGDLNYIPAPARLAFEMALHEEAERRALEGELAELERAWADAEGIAAIADSLTIPPTIDVRLEQLRQRPE
ncbi:hypothetical protein GEMMAAP_06325 [Gemmatimonas phototrophica]|uniref:Uncharacterized protein n=1 Tax=Gemmatimonas phototrophica TaxID=1379270 RepID=A0A143BHR5_9BACT|nr:hypothetical protein GEMMAAP_06325 [Gemmatimonas phototrophica]